MKNVYAARALRLPTLATIMLVVACQSNTEPAATPEVVAEIRAQATSLGDSGLLASAVRQRVLQSTSSATVVTLGEATHGTREFFVYKNQAIQLLIQNGTRIVAFEAPWAATRSVNAYVQGDPVPETAAMTALQYNVWRTEEVRDLLRMLRAANATRSASERVQFVGVDPQDYGFTTGDGTMAQLDTLLRRTDPLLANQVKQNYATAGAIADTATRAGRFTSAQVTRFTTVLRQASTAVAAAAPQLAASLGPSDAAWAVRSAEVLRLFGDQAVKSGAGDEDGAFTLRDSVMADNLLWWAQRSGTTRRAVLWGHNGHTGVVDTDGVRSTGWFLRRTLGNALVSVGFSFGGGQYNANVPNDPQTAPPAPSSTVDGALAAALTTPAWFDLRTVTGALATWFTQAKGTRWLGAGGDSSPNVYLPLTMRPTFDALIFVPTITASRKLP
ncbi:MAG: erythromycin esterase family protein [Gemmatimonas sp.]|jgi:erythromycin esterase|uniref:erythromycin esterase family protein n=1 Tax=Gemmatimonas sp. TaxID=1962908 RepID=UPI0025C01D35|nr:erythromycin esterase family protein [Gemmatimonas sp.]MCE2955444.1 erythromycin esterase family protein [Gemmatimonas sp.]